MRPDNEQERAPLTVEELEAGLQILDGMDIDHEKFWEETAAAFTATIRLAIHETSEALLLRKMPPMLRAKLEGQLAWLKDYLDQENRRAAALESRSESRGPPGPREHIMN